MEYESYLVATAIVLVLTGGFLHALHAHLLKTTSVSDRSLRYLSLCLMCWAAGQLPGFLALERTALTKGVSYTVSALTNVLLFAAVLELYQVRERRWADWLRSPARFWMAAAIILLPGLASATALALGDSAPPILSSGGAALDTVVSLSVLSFLAAGLALSFRRYSSLALSASSVVPVLCVAAYQLVSLYYTPGEVAGTGPQRPPALNALGFVGTAGLSLTFLALAALWSLSSASRLQRIGNSSHRNVVVIFIDLRGSTEFANNVKDPHYTSDFIDRLYRRLSTGLLPIAALGCGSPSLEKFLGDGYMFVFEHEAGDRELRELLRTTVDTLIELESGYRAWVNGPDAPFVHEPPRAIGVGVEFGAAARFDLANGSHDYHGIPLNRAAKLEGHARPDGGLVVSQHIYRTLEPEQQAQFLSVGLHDLGASDTPVEVYKACSTPTGVATLPPSSGCDAA